MDREYNENGAHNRNIFGEREDQDIFKEGY